MIAMTRSTTLYLSIFVCRKPVMVGNSLQIYCRCGHHSLLVRIGKSLKSTARCIKEERNKALHYLKQLISCSCAEPRELWNKSGIKKGELTQRLFDFCNSIWAPEEGPQHLLKNLALNFDKDSQDTEEFEGIQTEDVALAIAKFEHQVCGNVLVYSANVFSITFLFIFHKVGILSLKRLGRL
jgi:hypothetical protein